MLGKCFRATMSMFSSVQRLSSSSTSLDKEASQWVQSCVMGGYNHTTWQCYEWGIFLLCTDPTPKRVKMEWREIVSLAFQLFNMKHTLVWCSNESWQGLGKINFHLFMVCLPSSRWFYLSWKRRKASWAQILIRPSTGKVSSGLNASNIPLTHRVISRGE